MVYWYFFPVPKQTARSTEEIGDGGSPVEATFIDPSGVYVNERDDIYVSDRRDHRLRKIFDETIVTIVGTGVSGFSGEGISSSLAQISFPEGLTQDGSGNLFFADSSNHRIRKISSDGIITTVAGSGEKGFDGDNGPAIEA
jgi:hypothetical protein